MLYKYIFSYVYHKIYTLQYILVILDHTTLHGMTMIDVNTFYLLLIIDLFSAASRCVHLFLLSHLLSVMYGSTR